MDVVVAKKNGALAVLFGFSFGLFLSYDQKTSVKGSLLSQKPIFITLIWSRKAKFFHRDLGNPERVTIEPS
jgi:hypothetical protein